MMSGEDLEVAGACVEIQVLLEPFYLTNGLRFEDVVGFIDTISNHDCPIGDFIEFEKFRVALALGDLTVEQLGNLNNNFRLELFRSVAGVLGHNHISSLDLFLP